MLNVKKIASFKIRKKIFVSFYPLFCQGRRSDPGFKTQSEGTKLKLELKYRWVGETFSYHKNTHTNSRTNEHMNTLTQTYTFIRI